MRSISFFLSFLVITSVFFGLGFAQEREPAPCSGAERVENIIELFEQHAQQKIIEKKFYSAEYQELGRYATDGLIATLQQRVEWCETDSATLFNDLKEYITLLKDLQKFQEAKPSDTLMESKVLVLQSMLADLLNDTISPDMYFYQESVGTMALLMEGADFALQMDGEFNVQGVSDQAGSVADLSMDLHRDLAGSAEDQTIEVTLSGKPALRIVDGVLYFQFEDIELDVAGSLDEESAAQIATVKDQITLLQGKWIAIPLDESSADLGVGTFQMLPSLISLLRTHPILTAYYEEDGTIYGGINPHICTESIFGEGSDCLETRQRSYHQSQGRGFVFFRENLGVYSMGLTDAFTDEPMPSEIRAINGVPIITWDDSGYFMMDLPMDEFGHMHYEEGYLDMQLRIPGMAYDELSGSWKGREQTIALVGTLMPDHVALVGSMDFADFGGTIRIDATENNGKSDGEIRISLESPTQGTFPSIEFSMDYTNLLTPVSTIEVSAPDASEIIALESLLGNQF